MFQEQLRATSLARDNQAKLWIVHVEEMPVAYAGEFYYGMPQPDTAAIKEMLEQVKPGDPLVAYEHRLVAGRPANEIVDLAEGVNADLIVIGTHGPSGLLRLLLGSVAEAVVHKAPCPVLTFRAPEKSIENED